jgi:glycosyltransferase involved in cell wall biosynthesis
MQLSVIIPFVNEWPQIAFTIRSVAEDLRDRVDFEVIAIDNIHPLVEKHGYPADRGHEHYSFQKKNFGLYGIHNHTYDKRPDGAELQMSHIKSMSNLNQWLKYVRYDEKLSHWNAKRVGVEASTGEDIMFIDSHCVPARDSIYNAYKTYRNGLYNYGDIGTLHLPVSYHILEPRKLIYKPNVDIETGMLHYSFTQYRDANQPYEVACMSTCGMLMSRSLYSQVGGWPTELGIYGGGENFMNFSLAVLGKKKFIMPGGCLHHHGERRGYSSMYGDTLRNRMLATYIVGGKDFADKFRKVAKGRPEALKQMLEEITTHKDIVAHRKLIANRQQMTIGEWWKRWTKNN